VFQKCGKEEEEEREKKTMDEKNVMAVVPSKETESQ
jgi:hypothetical protein